MMARLRRWHQGLEGRAMIRFVIMGLLFVAAWFLVTRAIQFARTRQIDWTGVAFMVGFVVVALYLRHKTGIG
ncbi:hypothetical protein DY251_17345 [Mesorhizobium denitrificans]|uniref:Uncharacterized protein n=2 Tax=Phyllobacteriaceae TaxID=69277 RepID=A0A371X8L9_9HYPH|nr:hypothetical protein DY251_17345 [Mesorhizobium denitrificans]